MLPCLIKLMSNNGLQPRHTINFPKDYSNLNVLSSTPAHKLGLTLHQQHISLGMVVHLYYFITSSLMVCY